MTMYEFGNVLSAQSGDKRSVGRDLIDEAMADFVVAKPRGHDRSRLSDHLFKTIIGEKTENSGNDEK